MNQNKYRSTARAIRRGHITTLFNHLTGHIEWYRRTTTSKKFDVFLGSVQISN